MADKAYPGHRPARMQPTHSQEEASRSRRRSRRPRPQETPRPRRPLAGAQRPSDSSRCPCPCPRVCLACAPSSSGAPPSGAWPVRPLRPAHHARPLHPAPLHRRRPAPCMSPTCMPVSIAGAPAARSIFVTGAPAARFTPYCPVFVLPQAGECSTTKGTR
jgi:hypothetical protein